ncbi:MAG TPA: hypothetical protein VE198_18205 [Actinoallomurus sp.]|nr:hypothetical protein [Actinoallomurus sp.]
MARGRERLDDLVGSLESRGVNAVGVTADIRRPRLRHEPEVIAELLWRRHDERGDFPIVCGG